MLDLFLKPLGPTAAPAGRSGDGYYLSKDHRNLIMLVKPTQPSQDLDFDSD